MTPVTPVTIVVALLAAVAVTIVRPGRAVGIIIVSMLLWPEYLRIPIGLAQMSAPRVAATVFILRMVLKGDSQLRWNWVDTLVLVGWGWDLLANFVENADGTQLVYMTGRFFDTVCMYFAARLGTTGRNSPTDLYPFLAATAVALGIVGAIEAVSGSYLFDKLYAYGGQPWFAKEDEFRHGFLRARATTGHSIYFGMAMIVVTGLVYAARDAARKRLTWYCAVAAGLVGVLSSLSSGPQLGLGLLLIASAFFYFRRLIKPALLALVALCIFVELVSHRHFYQLIDYLALSEETAWYRARLLEVAVSHLPDYWLFGVGNHWPHHWGLEIDTRAHVDVVNHYIIVALYGGLPSLACYVGGIIGAGRASARVAVFARVQGMRRLGFGLVCTLIAVAGASMSVGLFGPPLLLMYMLMGVMVSLPAAAGLSGIARIATTKGAPLATSAGHSPVAGLRQC
jgi:hypothetical protein